MNHTDHYQLSQWEGTDRILRADFNSDNAKLDAALTGLQSGIDGAKTTAASALSQAESRLNDTINSTKTTLTGTINSTKTALESSIAGLDSRKVERVTLLSRSITASGDSISIPVSGAAWGQCQAVLLCIQPGGGLGNLLVNGDTRGVCYVGNSGAQSDQGVALVNGSYHTLLAAFPMGDGGAMVSFMGMGPMIQSGYSVDVTYDNLRSLVIKGGTFSGTWKITAIGLR